MTQLNLLTSNEQLRRAIGKLVRGLEKRDQEQRERRRHHRFYFGAKVSLLHQVGEGEYEDLCEAYAVDLSIGGISCITKQEMQTDDMIYISFEKLVGKPCLIPIMVRNCVTLLEGIFHIHAQYSFLGETVELERNA